MDPGAALPPPQAVPLPDPVARAARLVTEIFKRRRDALKPKPNTRPNSVYASNIPHCERAGVYEFTNPQDKIPFTWELKALFQAGNVNEDAYKAQLRDLGFDLKEDGAPLSPDMRAKYNIGGYLDWRVAWEGKRITFEAKLMSPMIFDKIEGLSAAVLTDGSEITQQMIERGVESMKRFPWTEKYLRQITVYLLGTSEEVGIFALTDGRGRWKFVIVPLDYDLAEKCLKKVESINRHVAAGTQPERIPYDPMYCGKCAFINVCIPDLKTAGLLEINNTELPALLEVRDAHIDSWRKVEQIDKKVKAFFEGVKDGIFNAGNWIVTRKAEQRKQVDFPDDATKARYQVLKTIYKNKFERFAKPDPESIYVEPKRSFTFAEDDI